LLFKKNHSNQKKISFGPLRDYFKKNLAWLGQLIAGINREQFIWGHAGFALVAFNIFGDHGEMFNGSFHLRLLIGAWANGMPKYIDAWESLKPLT